MSTVVMGELPASPAAESKAFSDWFLHTSLLIPSFLNAPWKSGADTQEASMHVLRDFRRTLENFETNPSTISRLYRTCLSSYGGQSRCGQMGSSLPLLLPSPLGRLTAQERSLGMGILDLRTTHHVLFLFEMLMAQPSRFLSLVRIGVSLRTMRDDLIEDGWESTGVHFMPVELDHLMSHDEQMRCVDFLVEHEEYPEEFVRESLHVLGSAVMEERAEKNYARRKGER